MGWLNTVIAKISGPAVGEEDLLAVVKIMIVAMYQDRHLEAAEMDQIDAFIAKHGMSGDLQARVKLPSAIAEVRQHITPGGNNSAYLTQLCRSIRSEDARLLAATACNDVIRSDREVTASEKAALGAVITALRG
jgi:hypothetical protein